MDKISVSITIDKIRSLRSQLIFIYITSLYLYICQKLFTYTIPYHTIPTLSYLSLFVHHLTKRSLLQLDQIHLSFIFAECENMQKISPAFFPSLSESTFTEQSKQLLRTRQIYRREIISLVTKLLLLIVFL